MSQLIVCIFLLLILSKPSWYNCTNDTCVWLYYVGKYTSVYKKNHHLHYLSRLAKRWKLKQTAKENIQHRGFAGRHRPNY